MARKNFKLNYDPENNKNNIYARKLQGQVPATNSQFAENPLTKMLQPVNITKSKRFARDKLNITDIPGAQVDVYKKYRMIEGREYIDTSDIRGAQPAQLKHSKPMTGPDYKLYTKDINPDKWKTKRVVDPLKPEYEMSTKSGRMMRVGQIEGSQPKIHISPETRRFANYVEDIDGTKPKKLTAINDEQRMQASQVTPLDLSQRQNASATRSSMPRNAFANHNFQNMPSQQQLLNESSNHSGPAPNSHYARFQSFQSLQQTAKFGGNSLIDIKSQGDNQQDNYHSKVSMQNYMNNGQGIHYQPPSLQQIPSLQMHQPQNVIPTKSRRMNGLQNQLNQLSQDQSQIYNSTSNHLPTIQNQQKNKTSLALHDRLSSKRMQTQTNTYELLEKQNPISLSHIEAKSAGNSPLAFNDQKAYQNQQVDYVKPSFLNNQNQLYTSSNTLETPNTQGLEESPVPKNRVWSKARIIGQEMNDQQNRVNSSSFNMDLSQNKRVQALNLKKNFNDNMYQKGILMNSGHKSLISNSINQHVNPLSNEIARSAEGTLFNSKSLASRDQRLGNKIQKIINPNPISQQIPPPYGGYSPSHSNNGNLNFGQSSHQITKSLLPPTTSKAYGNFLDGKQIDQMIQQLKQNNNNNPIV